MGLGVVLAGLIQTGLGLESLDGLFGHGTEISVRAVGTEVIAE